MRIFQCDQCGQPVYFDNVGCEACGAALGFDPARLRFVAVSQSDPAQGSAGPWQSAMGSFSCANYRHGACNWLAEGSDPDGFCVSCRLNQTIPPLNNQRNLEAWRELEASKRRLVYSLLRLGLPLQNKVDAPEGGLAFDFLSEYAQPDGEDPVVTGHANGLITININEADSVHRERARRSMGEPYRTLIGHFRHEAGHYYWERLVFNDDQLLERFRMLFGDERRDYAEALKAHYAIGAPSNWRNHYLSAYASSHPWEDWAESWAHYLHMVDTLETAHAFGFRLEPTQANMAAHCLHTTFDPYDEPDMRKILSAALPLTLAVNSLNRGMGLPDIYPFVFAPPVLDKLEYIHSILRATRTNSNPG